MQNGHLTRYLFSLLIFFASCGNEVEVYEWQKLNIFNFNIATEQTTETQEVVPYNNFAIKVELETSPLITLRSSDWVNSSSGYQSNDRIREIEVLSSVGFNSEFPSDSLLNEIFEASLLSEPQNRYDLPIFLNFFGQKSKRIDNGFYLFIKEGERAANPNQRFTVRLLMTRGRILIEQTNFVTLE